MTNALKTTADALSFAHLTGLGGATPLAAEDDDPNKQREGETADEYAKRMAAEDEVEDDKDDKDEPAATYADGVAAERARCSTVFASPAAGRNIALAAELTFGTDLPADRVVALLEKAPSAGLHRPERAARNPNVGSTAGPAQSPQQASAARWDKHLQAANPHKRT